MLISQLTSNKFPSSWSPATVCVQRGGQKRCGEQVAKLSNTTFVRQAKGRPVPAGEVCTDFKGGQEEYLTPFARPLAHPVLLELTQSSPVTAKITGPRCSGSEACRVWDLTSKPLVWLQQQWSVIKSGTKPKLLRISHLSSLHEQHARCSAPATKVQEDLVKNSIQALTLFLSNFSSLESYF